MFPWLKLAVGKTITCFFQKKHVSKLIINQDGEIVDMQGMCWIIFTHIPFFNYCCNSFNFGVKHPQSFCFLIDAKLDKFSKYISQSVSMWTIDSSLYST